MLQASESGQDTQLQLREMRVRAHVRRQIVQPTLQLTRLALWGVTGGVRTLVEGPSQRYERPTYDDPVHSDSSVGDTKPNILFL